ncbi:hypothetical protein LV78_001852 [Actinosynnema pretiosum]|nr:hypothetical protein [Actinosynnema pretiosum]
MRTSREVGGVRAVARASGGGTRPCAREFRNPSGPGGAREGTGGAFHNWIRGAAEPRRPTACRGSSLSGGRWGRRVGGVAGPDPGPLGGELVVSRGRRGLLRGPAAWAGSGCPGAVRGRWAAGRSRRRGPARCSGLWGLLGSLLSGMAGGLFLGCSGGGGPRVRVGRGRWWSPRCPPNVGRGDRPPRDRPPNGPRTSWRLLGGVPSRGGGPLGPVGPLSGSCAPGPSSLASWLLARLDRAPLVRPGQRFAARPGPRPARALPAPRPRLVRLLPAPRPACPTPLCRTRVSPRARAAFGLVGGPLGGPAATAPLGPRAADNGSPQFPQHPVKC